MPKIPSATGWDLNDMRLSMPSTQFNMFILRNSSLVTASRNGNHVTLSRCSAYEQFFNWLQKMGVSRVIEGWPDQSPHRATCAKPSEPVIILKPKFGLNSIPCGKMCVSTNIRHEWRMLLPLPENRHDVNSSGAPVGTKLFM